ncbi:MAG TPA: hypothetical protein VL523_20460 [Terriglobia bacterium]|nr:hypothetical protein [Terriglobia bacterium]
MPTRIQDIIDNVAANVVAAGVILAVGAGGGILIALFVSVTHGLSRLDQAVLIGCSAVFLAMFSVLVYVGVMVARRRKNTPVAPGPLPVTLEPPRPETPQDRVLLLARDLLAFLKECGPKPPSPSDTADKEIISKMTPEQILGDPPEVSHWYNKVHHLYAVRFAQRVETLSHELSATGVNEPQLRKAVIDSPYTADKIKRLVPILFHVAANLAVGEAVASLGDGPHPAWFD